MLHLAAITLAGLVTSTAPELIVPSPSVHAAVSAQLGAGSYTIQSLEIPPFPGGDFAVEVNLDGQSVWLELSPHSVRAEDYELLISDGKGGLVPVPAPAPRTVRGSVVQTGAHVSGSLLRNGLSVIIQGNQGSWAIQPLSDVVPAARALHVVMPVEDMMPIPGICPGGVVPPPALPPMNRGGGGARGTVLVAEISGEADYPMFERNGLDLADTVADIEMIMNNVSLAYERDVSVTFLLDGLIVRTSQADDPYTSTDPNTLLDQFRMWWNANQGAQVRDLAHLFTGRQLDGSVIGLAYLGVVCTNPNWSYGLSESRYTLNVSNRTALTAHEIGHNFSGTHCSGSDCHIMCPTLGGCGGIGLPNFGPIAISEIGGFAASGSCLEPGEGQPLPLPVVDQFPLPSFNTRTWSIIDNALVTANVAGEPSPPYAALLRSTAALETDLINLSGPFDEPVTVSFWLQTNSVESGERLTVRHTPEGGSPQTIATISSSSPDLTTFGLVRLRLPAEALGGNGSIGLVTNGNSTSDEWYVDAFTVEQAEPVELPTGDTFPGLLIDQLIWPTNSGAIINQGSPDPPSPPNVLNLDRSDWIESRTLPGSMVAPGQDAWVDGYVQSNGVESSKPLVVRYRSTSGTWIKVWEHRPRSTDRSTFKRIRFPLPNEAEHDNVALRIYASGTDSADDWFLDDLFIELGPAFSVPWSDSFDDVDELIDPALWFPIEGAVINQGGTGNPSGANVLNLDWSDRITSRVCDATVGGPNDRLVVRMWLQHNGVEIGKSLFLDYRSSAGNWVNAGSIASGSASRTTIGQVELALPPDAVHDAAQIRLRTDGTDGSDDWFVDDFSLTLQGPLSLPVADSFPATVLSSLVWADDDNVAINSGAVGMPSPPYVMNLDRDEFAITQPIDASSTPADAQVLVSFWLQHNGVEPGKHLFVDYTDSSGLWHNAGTFSSSSPDRVTLGRVHVPLGSDATHAQLQVRLRVDGTEGFDDWFIDDLHIESATGLDEPLMDSFPSTHLDPWVWRAIVGSPVINQGGLNPPTPPYVLNLDVDESLETAPFEAGVLSGQRPSVAFYLQHNGVEAGKSLAVDLVYPNESTQRLGTFVSDSTDRTPFNWYTLDLPLGTNADVKIRLTVDSPEPNDDWFLDDVYVGEKTELRTPWVETFENALTYGLRNWTSTTTATASTLGQNEPSGAASLQIGVSQAAGTLPIRLSGAASPQYFRAWFQHVGGDAGDRLIVFYINDAGAQQVLRLIDVTDAGADLFLPVQVELPADALHDDLVILLSWVNGSGVWFVDDVYVGPQAYVPDCPPDLTGDGVLDFFDVVAFLNAFASGDPAADLTGDGVLDFFDVATYLGLFDSGCG